jgi:hypothetical protein
VLAVSDVDEDRLAELVNSIRPIQTGDHLRSRLPLPERHLRLYL